MTFILNLAHDAKQLVLNLYKKNYNYQYIIPSVHNKNSTVLG